MPPGRGKKGGGAGRLPALLLAAPLCAFGLLVGGAVCVALVSAGPGGCGAEEAGDVHGVPAKLVPVFQGAAAAYKLGRQGPAYLAGINWVESGFGANPGTSSAGAQGWMQFMPATWAVYGVDADKDGVKDPFDPDDAIYSAARYLHVAGAPRDWHGAVFAYNHAEWYVDKVVREAKRFGLEASAAAPAAASLCAPGDAALGKAIRLFAPRSFKPLPAELWAGGGSPEAVDARVWPDAVWLLKAYGLQVTAARESGHQTHGDGTAMDMVPAPGRGWDESALSAAEALGWVASCGASGSAPVCPLVPAIQFIGYNGYPGHGDPAHAGENAHLHVSWKSSSYGCPGLCAPREWVEVFPWGG
jgi:hypothetical protein